MGTNHMGRQSIRFPQPPVVRGFASVAGKKEREGPLGDQFTATVQDTTFGEKSWERAERRMQQMTLELALEKAGLTDADLDAAFAGDLLNQCIGSSFSLRNRGVPTLGLYGACSTMAESLLLAAMSVSGGYARTALAILSQFRPDDLRRIVPLRTGSGIVADAATGAVTDPAVAQRDLLRVVPRLPRPAQELVAQPVGIPVPAWRRRK